MTFLKAIQELCKKLNLSYSDVNSGLNGLFSLDDIKGFIIEAHDLVWDFKSWDHTEGDKTTDLASPDLLAGYIDYPQDFVSGSIYLMLVDGAEFYQTTYRDLKKYLAQNPNGDTKYYAERKRFIFINANAVSAGQTIDFSGKLRPTVLADDTDLMQFSDDVDNKGMSGNSLVVQLAYSLALASEKKKDKTGSKREEDDAYAKLSDIWKQIGGSRMTQKGTRPQYDVPDFYAESGDSIGTFNNN